MLNVDRTNNVNAIPDDLPPDFEFIIYAVVNTAVVPNVALFSVAVITGAVPAKIVGLVLGITEGRIAPAILVYLGGYHKSTEHAARFALYRGAQNLAIAVGGLIASDLLQMRGIAGLYGWK
ncbi:hypothetical protein ACEPAH_2556 [Sanghuangporus vaninii]